MGEYGNEQFGYDNINSARSEGGNPALGVVSGTIVNKAHGSVLNYVADAAGFRIVGASNALWQKEAWSPSHQIRHPIQPRILHWLHGHPSPWILNETSESSSFVFERTLLQFLVILDPCQKQRLHLPHFLNHEIPSLSHLLFYISGKPTSESKLLIFPVSLTPFYYSPI